MRARKHPGALGVEVEHFVVTAEGEHPVSSSGAKGNLAFVMCWRISLMLTRSTPMALKATSSGLLAISLHHARPAAQLEISIAPYLSISKILRVYSEFRSKVDLFLAEHGCKLVTSGYDPTARALELTLIPKQRYRFMNDYFMEIGTRGERMMRASASTQSFGGLSR